MKLVLRWQTGVPFSGAKKPIIFPKYEKLCENHYQQVQFCTVLRLHNRSAVNTVTVEDTSINSGTNCVHIRTIVAWTNFLLWITELVCCTRRKWNQPNRFKGYWIMKELETFNPLVAGSIAMSLKANQMNIRLVTNLCPHTWWFARITK